jgi:hypothetical protein
VVAVLRKTYMTTPGAGVGVPVVGDRVDKLGDSDGPDVAGLRDGNLVD